MDIGNVSVQASYDGEESGQTPFLPIIRDRGKRWTRPCTPRSLREAPREERELNFTILSWKIPAPLISRKSLQKHHLAPLHLNNEGTSVPGRSWLVPDCRIQLRGGCRDKARESGAACAWSAFPRGCVREACLGRLYSERLRPHTQESSKRQVSEFGMSTSDD